MKKLLLISIVTSVVVLSGCTALKTGSSNSVEGLAKCLSEKGATFYGTERCSHCKDQKAMFGTAMQYVNFVDCDFEMPKCNAAKIEGYPTRVLKDGTRMEGTQELSALAQATSCAYTTVPVK